MNVQQDRKLYLHHPFIAIQNDDVLKMHALGVMNGYEDGKFGPDKYLTYAEVVTIIYRTVQVINNGLRDKYGEVSDYPNIPYDTEHWVVPTLYASKKLGLLDGVCYDMFRTDDTANRRDAVGIVANAYTRLIEE